MQEMASLNARLLALATQRRATLPEIYAKTLDKIVQHLRDVGMFEGALRIGDTLPPFLCPNARGELVSSDELLEKGPLVVSFFRGDWCPYCTMTLQALGESFDAIEAEGAQLVAVTPDLIPVTARTVSALSLPFEVLSDVDSAFGLQCGVIYRMPDDMMEFYRAHDISRRHGVASFFLPIPAVFVADQRGTIRHAYVDPDFTQRLEPSEIVRILRDLKQEKR